MSILRLGVLCDHLRWAFVRMGVTAGRWTGGDICCSWSHINTFCQILSKISTIIYSHNVSATLDYQRNRLGCSSVTALDLLYKLFVFTFTSKSVDPPFPNFIQMLRTKMYRQCPITTWLTLVTKVLWSLIDRNCLINYLYEIYSVHPLTNARWTFYKCWWP